jgi:acetoin utilization protein AcuB
MQNTTPISRIMTRKPATVSPEDNLETVRNILEQHGFHHVPVIESGKLAGIVSYTDYLRVIRELYGNAQERSTNARLLHTVLVKEVMTEHPICLAPTDTVEDALRIFNTNHFHAIPVIEDNRHLVGILSTQDLIRMLERILAPDIDYASE